MDADQIKGLINAQLNSSFWWIVGVAAALFFKNAVENFVWGMTFLMSRDYNVDDEVLIGGTRKGRIVRQTITKTVFYMYDNHSRLIVPNKDLPLLRCEKVLSGERMSSEPPTEEEQNVSN